MANVKITQLGTHTNPDTADVLPIVDVSDAGGAGVTKQVAVGEVVGKITGDVNVATDGTSSIAPGVIVDADVNASAAIAGSKIDPAFGSQNVTTTGTVTGASLNPTSNTVPTNGVYLPALNSVGISTSGTGRLFVDADGNVLVEKSSGANSITLSTFVGNANDSTLRFQKARGGGASPTQIGTTDNLGAIEWYGYDGSSYNKASSITSKASANTGDFDASLNYVSNSHSFGDGSTDYLYIASSGNVGLGTNSPDCALQVVGNALIGASGSQENSAYQGEIRSGGNVTLKLQAGASNTAYLGFGTTSSALANNIQLNNSSGLLGINVNGSIRLAITSAGNVGIGPNGAGGYDVLFNPGTSSSPLIRDSSGRLLVGTPTARTDFKFGGTSVNPLNQIESDGAETALAITRNAGNTNAPTIYLGKSRGGSAGATTIVQSGDRLGSLSFNGADGSNLIQAARIEAEVDGDPDPNDDGQAENGMPGRLVFSVTADGASSPTERMRINNAGDLMYGTGGNGIDAGSGSVDGLYFNNTNKQIIASRDGAAILTLRRRTSDGTIQGFYRDTTIVGTISVTTTATAYNTSSDYRLKENVTPVTDGITRLQQLKPSRFNFIADPDKTVDGFLAHEVQAIVPEAITGEKDAVDDDGNPQYQGIDQSKLVPLLTAALQEAIGEIESLKARVAALENA